MYKRAVVSFSNIRGNYIPAMKRLEESLKGNFDGDFFGFVGEESIGAPKHEDNPYAFKVYAIKQVIKLGYSSILWLDSSCFAIKNISPIFDETEEYGMIFQEAGHYLGSWSNDDQLRYFGMTREEAMKVPMIGNAGFLGFDFTNAITSRFFELWGEAMQSGMFKGSWENSRHDMTCSSALVYLLSLGDLAKKGDEWLEYAPPGTAPKNETILIQASGM